MAELTPFPDGQGYLEHAWSGLSAPQRHSLRAAGRGARPHQLHVATRRSLMGRGLIEWNPDVAPGTPAIVATSRGQALIKWATETGRIT